MIDWMTPASIAASIAGVQAEMEERRQLDRRCRCRVPLRTRKYLGSWACVCGRLIGNRRARIAQEIGGPARAPQHTAVVVDPAQASTEADAQTE